MKKIGIFADSHGDCTYIEWKSMYKSIGLGWPELLALKYKVKNFSMGGSGIYYSYDIFKQVHSEFDIIIFIPSQSTRFSLYCPDYGQVRHMVPGFLLGQASRELENLRILNRLDDYKATEAAIGYVTYILDEKKEDEMKRLMLQEVKRLRPDTIVIPAFPDDRIADSDIVMCEISGRELHMYNTSLPVLRSMQKPLLDLRKCHMTDENNRMLFHKIMTAIDNQDTSVRLAESDILQPKDPFTKYFVYENGRTNI